MTLREEVSRKDVEIAQLERSMAKQGEEMKALVSASGSERESMLVSELSEARTKMHELEKQVEQARGAAVKQAKSAAVADVASARAEVAEGEASRLREEAV